MKKKWGKLEIEKEKEKEKEKRQNRSIISRSGNAGHVFDVFQHLLSTYQLTLFGCHFEYNYRSSIPDTIEGDNVELIESELVFMFIYVYLWQKLI